MNYEQAAFSECTVRGHWHWQAPGQTPNTQTRKKFAEREREREREPIRNVANNLRGQTNSDSGE